MALPLSQAVAVEGGEAFSGFVSVWSLMAVLFYFTIIILFGLQYRSLFPSLISYGGNVTAGGTIHSQDRGKE